MAASQKGSPTLAADLRKKRFCGAADAPGSAPPRAAGRSAVFAAARDLLLHGVVMLEAQRESGAALGCGAQRGGEAEELAHGSHAREIAHAAPLAEFLDLAAAVLEQADGRAERLFRRHDFHAHDGFEHRGTGFFHGVAHGHGGGHAAARRGGSFLADEGHDDVDVLHRIAGLGAGEQAVGNALKHFIDENLGNGVLRVGGMRDVLGK